VTPAEGGSYSPREILLAAAARAVLAAFREPLEHKRLSAPATATLRVLEAALELYADPLPPPHDPPP
jgi:hypothetical protein